MVKRLARSVVLVGSLALATVLPATAQSRWDVASPAFLGLAEDGFLITVAPPTFVGCSEGSAFVVIPGMPNLDMWSVVLVLDEGAPVWSFRFVSTPHALNILQESDAWIRVFPVGAGDVEAFREAPCLFYGTRPYVAEGLGRMNYHSADDSLTGPGVNSWGWTIQGDLNDNGYCMGGRSPRLFWLQRWVSFSQTDVTIAKSTSSRGPTLTCK